MRRILPVFVPILVVSFALILLFHPIQPIQQSSLVQTYYDYISLKSLEATVAQFNGLYIVTVASVETVPASQPEASLFGGTVENELVTFNVRERFKGPDAKILRRIHIDERSVGSWPGEESQTYLLLLGDSSGKNQLLDFGALSQLPPLDHKIPATEEELQDALRQIGPIAATNAGAIPVFFAGFEHSGVNGPGIAPSEARPAGWLPVSELDHWFDVTVPITSEVESLARTWLASSDVHRRFSGIRALAYFPSADNAALLRKFLESRDSEMGGITPDPSDEPGISPWSGSRYYPLRIAAAASLREMGYSVPRVDLTEPPHPYFASWPLAIFIVVPIALWFSLRRVRFLRTRLRRAAAFVLLLSVPLIVHSFFRAHIFATTAFCTYYDLTLYRGTLRYEALHEFPFACRPCYACIPIVRREPTSLFGPPEENLPPISMPWHGFATETGELYGDLGLYPGITVGPPSILFKDAPFPAFLTYYPVQLVNLPVWLIPVIVLAMPLLFVRRYFRFRRRQYRLQHNLCPACAYDLRGHPPGATCPECGTSSANAPKRV